MLFTAILLLYIFYYQSDIKEKSIEEVKIQNEKLDKLGKSNYFEDVEYKGIDANGNRYLLKSKEATFSDESPEIVKNAPHRQAIKKINAGPLEEPESWAMTWRAYLRKNLKK